MNCRTTILAGSFAVALCGGVAQAQDKSRPRTGEMTARPAPAPAKKPARTGVIPLSPPAQPIVVNTTGLPMNTTGPIPNATHLPSNSPVRAPAPIAQLSYYPTVVLTDGRVLANFGTGRGYEQVLRKCPSFAGSPPPGVYVSPCWTVDAYGRYAVIQQR
jgi:hypothetical protein